MMLTGSVSNRVPIDRGWAWVIALGYFHSVFCMVGTAKSFGILLPRLVSHFEITNALAALVMGVCGGVYTLAAPFCIAAGQHFGHRKVVMFGGLIGALGISLSGFLFNISWVILTFGALFGFGNACLFGNGLTILGQYFQKWRGLANGLALSGASIGQFAMPPLLQFLLDEYSLQGTLIITGAMYLHVIICGALFRPTTFYTGNRHHFKQTKTLVENHISLDDKQLDSNEDESNAMIDKSNDLVMHVDAPPVNEHNKRNEIILDNEKQSENKDTDQHSQSKCKNFVLGLLDFTVLKSVIVLMFVIVSFLLFVGHYNFFIFMPSAAKDHGVSSKDSALLMSITGIFDFMGRVLVGFIGDLRLVARYKMMSTVCILCGLSILGFSFATQYWTMAVFLGFYGFLGGCYVSINAPVLIDLIGLKSLPKVLGVVLFIQGLGSALGQPLFGAVRDCLGSYNPVFYICSFSMVSGAVILAFYPLVKKFHEGRKHSKSLNLDGNMEVKVHKDI